MTRFHAEDPAETARWEAEKQADRTSPVPLGSARDDPTASRWAAALTESIHSDPQQARRVIGWFVIQQCAVCALAGATFGAAVVGLVWWCYR